MNFTHLVRKWKIQFLIFIFLFLLLEIVLRLFGMKAGTLIDDFIVEDNPIYEARFSCDEIGINHIYSKSTVLMQGTVINNQGFRSNFDYTRQIVDSIRKTSHKQIIMLIGDSYVEGCCPDNVRNSFPDIINRDSNYCVLNFGVSGTDPLQYELITQKYVKELKPDKVVVAFYFGNDILPYVRKPSPGIVITYPFKNNKWLFSVTNSNLSLKDNYVLKTPKEAYQFFIDHYTLKGKKRNFFEKTLSFSVCFSKLYLVIEHKLGELKWSKMCVGRKIKNENDIANNTLKQIKCICDSFQTPLIFVGIPAPFEAEEGDKLKEKYKLIFKGLEWHVPSNLKTTEYDGLKISNHFNNDGHKKFAAFLKGLLNQSRENESLNRN